MLEETLWGSSHLRNGNREEFAITTNRDGSLTLSREMAMAIERVLNGLRFALGMSISLMARGRQQRPHRRAEPQTHRGDESPNSLVIGGAEQRHLSQTSARPSERWLFALSRC